MKTQTIVKEITHEDLVNLLSGALYGSNYLSADYEEAVEYDEDDSYEDVMANILLHGGTIYITDHYAEDGEVYGNLSCEVKEDDEGNLNTIYSVTLNDIKDGLERAVNGTFNAGANDELISDWRERNIEFAKRSFEAFSWNEKEWDAITADCLMQIILFDEIVYG